MKIGIIAASGKAGQLIMKEALLRGHDVTAIVRNPEKIVDSQVTILQRDIFEISYKDIKDFDILVDAFNAPHGQEELHQTTIGHLITILSGHKTPRLMVVGGAGSLYVDVDKSIRLMDTPDFPKDYLPTAVNMGKAFNMLKESKEINWTYLSPSAMFNPDGERTTKYSIGLDNLLTNKQGNSEISYADYAIAMLDEIETGKHLNQRFTVVSE